MNSVLFQEFLNRRYIDFTFYTKYTVKTTEQMTRIPLIVQVSADILYGLVKVSTGVLQVEKRSGAER